MNRLISVLNLDDEFANLTIENVLFDKFKKDLRIDIVSSKIINDDKIGNLELNLREKLSKINKIEINISYRLNFIECFADYESIIIKHIRDTIPSSSGWVEELELRPEKGKLEIITATDVVEKIMKENSIDKKLMEKIYKEFEENIQVEVNKCDDIADCNSIEHHNKNKQKEEEILIGKIKKEQEENINTKPKRQNKSNSEKNGFKKYSRGSRALVQKINEKTLEIEDINTESGLVCTDGEVFKIEKRTISGNKIICTFNMTNYKNTVSVKIFIKESQEEEYDSVIEEGNFIRVRGEAIFDTYSRQLVLMLKNMEKLKKEKTLDNYPEKRVELHLHTKMSAMDGIANVNEAIDIAADWGHEAIAITDHGVLQSFPDAMQKAKERNIKIIYGLEGYLVDDEKDILENFKESDLNTEFVVFDLETTGLSPRLDDIIEIGAVKLKNGIVIDEYSQLINTKKIISEKIEKLTEIDNNMISNKPFIEDIIENFIDFIGEDSILVAHNAPFDMSFLREKAKNILNIDLKNSVLDTLDLSRTIYKELKSFKLDKIAKHLGISLKNHHRAVDDSRATAEILLRCIEDVEAMGIKSFTQLNKYFKENININHERTYHVTIYAKNYIGLKNLYRIVSESHLNYFYKRPRITKSLLNNYRDGLLIGTACEAGELYQSILNKYSFEKINNIIKFYDILEIQPILNNEFLIRNEIVENEEELRNINKDIVNLGEKHKKMVIATGDVHFLRPRDSIYREILMAGQGFSDYANQPPLYLKTTGEMMEEFSYLGEKKAKEVVITNTRGISDMIENIKPIPDGTFPPEIEGSDENLREMNYANAREKYGNPLPEIVEERLERELNSIIGNGYAVMYIIAQKLVDKSLRDGYLVGSRGSVGSSFVATMSNITEVNPLVPHYICEECKYSEFMVDGSVGSGIDLEDKNCPRCGNELKKEGHDIPFEVFLGFDGDKEPDIDLNFAGEYQVRAHKYTEELFGEEYVYRAGTIGTIAEKTAYGFVRKYFDSIEKDVNSAEVNRLLLGCTGIKRTSGQHPGGLMVIPSNKDIYDFTPVQYPANDKESGVITTHFDYNAISGRILKLDILGHDVPSIIKLLEDITEIDAMAIDLKDRKTMELFTGTTSMGIDYKEITSKVGTLGIPEFGTKFVRQMLVDTKPTTFSELIRISGLSHGTDVWINNAQDLIKSNQAKLSEVICTRDDIMNYLIQNGLNKALSFKIMEKVRKGQGITDEEEILMKENNIPTWYIESCKKIKYMFPKAHAVAYVMMSFRIAYFKVHYPLAFYATYFTTKAVDFDSELILKGRDNILNKIKEIESLEKTTAKEKSLMAVLEVALEMIVRGFKFKKVNIYESHSDRFTIVNGSILPPLKSLDGVGENIARNISKERESGEFISVEDLVRRTGASKTVIEALTTHGCFLEIPESNQLNLFSS